MYARPARFCGQMPCAALWRIDLFAVGAVACALADGFDLARPHVPLPRQKILLIAAQYGVVLPAIALALWRAVGLRETQAVVTLVSAGSLRPYSFLLVLLLQRRILICSRRGVSPQGVSTCQRLR